MPKPKGVKYWPILLLAVLPAGTAAQNSKTEDWNTIGKICGRVTDSEFTSTPWASHEVFGGARPKKVEVALYRRSGQKKCCPKKETPVSEARTGNDGAFEFTDVAPGPYWLIVVVGKKKYKLALTFDPSREDHTDCPDVVYQIRADRLRPLKMCSLH